MALSTTRSPARGSARPPIVSSSRTTAPESETPAGPTTTTGPEPGQRPGNDSVPLDRSLQLATEELTRLMRKVGPDSVAGMILRHTLQEMASLAGVSGSGSGENPAAPRTQAYGPYRVPRAA